jgi:heme-degrading monooxygenase HmoA
MVRIIYRWTVKSGEEDQFIRDWKEGTHRIQTNCEGAHGSYLTRSMKNPSHFFGTARWASAQAWTTAQSVMKKLNLPGPLPESADFYDEIEEIAPA